MKKLAKSLLALSILGLTGGTAAAGGVLFAKDSGKQETVYAETALSGEGTAANPYQINNADDLSKLATSHTNAIYELTADIYLDNKLWTPIGTEDNAFTGTIWGNGYEISGSIIVPESVLSNYYGIFGYTSGAQIYDLSIGETFTYTGTNTSAVSGSLIGYAKGTTIAAVYDKSSMTNTIGGVSGTETEIYRGGNNFGGSASTVDTTVRVGAGTETKGYAVAFNVDDTKDTAKSAYYVDASGNKLMRNKTDKTETYYVAISSANAAQSLTNAPKNFGTTYPNVANAVAAKRKGYELESGKEWKGSVKDAVYSSNSGFALAAENYTLRANWSQVTYTFNRWDKIGTTGTETANGTLTATMYSSWAENILSITNSTRDLIGITIYDGTSALVKIKRTVTYDASGNKTLSDWVYYHRDDGGEAYNGEDKDQIILDEKSRSDYKLVATWQAVTVQAEIVYSNGNKVGANNLGLTWTDGGTEKTASVDSNNKFSILGNTAFTLKFTLRDGYAVDSVKIEGNELNAAGSQIKYSANLVSKNPEQTGAGTYEYTCERGVLSNDNKILLSISQVKKSINIKTNESTIKNSATVNGTTLTTSLPTNASISGGVLSTFVDQNHTLVFAANAGNGIKKIATSNDLECNSLVITYYYLDSTGAWMTTTSASALPNYGAEYAVMTFNPKTIKTPEQTDGKHIAVETVSRSININFEREGNTAYPSGISATNPVLSVSSKVSDSQNNTVTSNGPLSLGNNTGVITIAAASNKYYRIKKVTVNGVEVTGSNGTYTYNGVVPEGTYTIKATYEKPTYVIKFNTNGAETPSTCADLSGNIGDGITLPGGDTLTKTGYTCTGWMYNEKIVDWTTMPDLTAFDTSSTITLTAQWKANKYSVTLDPNGGTLPSSSSNVIEVTYDGKYGQLPSPSRTGYTFKGWWTTETGGTKVEATSDVKTASAHTIYAHWEAIKYTITYYLDGGTINGTNPTEYNVESAAITLKNPTKTGYQFTGWSGTDITGNSTSVTIPTGSIGNRTYTAHWEIITYTISYDLDGGTINGTNPTEYNVGSAAITLKNPTKTGYQFTGWSGTGITDKSTSVTISTGSTGDRSYKANWVANKYTLRFYSYAGRSPSDQEISYDSLNLKTLSCDSVPGLNHVGYALKIDENTYKVFKDGVTDVNLSGIDTSGKTINQVNVLTFNDELIPGLSNNNGGTYDVYVLWELSVSDILFYLDLSNVTGIDNSLITNKTEKIIFENKSPSTELFTVTVYGEKTLGVNLQVRGQIAVSYWNANQNLSVTVYDDGRYKLNYELRAPEGSVLPFKTKTISPECFKVKVKQYSLEIRQSKDQLDLAAQYMYKKIGTEALADDRDGRIAQGRWALKALMKASPVFKSNIYNVLDKTDLSVALTDTECDLALCSTFGSLRYKSNIWTTNVEEIEILDVGTINGKVFTSWEDLQPGIYDTWWKVSGDLKKVSDSSKDFYTYIDGFYYIRNNYTEREKNYNYIKEQQVIVSALPENAVMLSIHGALNYTYVFTDARGNEITIKTSDGDYSFYTQTDDTQYFTIEKVLNSDGEDITNSAVYWIPGTLTIETETISNVNYVTKGVYADGGKLEIAEFTEDTVPTVAVTKIKYNNKDYAYQTGFIIDENNLVSLVETNTLLGYIRGQGTDNLTVQLLNGITYEYTVSQPETGMFGRGNSVGLIKSTSDESDLGTIKNDLRVALLWGYEGLIRNGLTRSDESVGAGYTCTLYLTRAVGVIVDLSARYRPEFTDYFFMNMGDEVDLLSIYPMILNCPTDVEVSLEGEYKDASGKKWYIFEIPGEGSIFMIDPGNGNMPTMRAILDEAGYAANITKSAGGKYTLKAGTQVEALGYPGFTYGEVTGPASEVVITDETIVGVADQHKNSFDPVHVKVSWIPNNIPVIKGTSEFNFATSEAGTKFDANDFITSVEGFYFNESQVPSEQVGVLDTISCKWKETNSNILTLKNTDDEKAYTIIITLTSKSEDYTPVEYVYYVTFTAVKQVISPVISSSNGLSNTVNSYTYSNKDLYSGFAVGFKDTDGNVMTLNSSMYTVTKEAAAKNAGSYQVKIALTEEGKKYYDFADYTFSFVIAEKEISISDTQISNATKVYDGNALIATSVYTELGEKVDITFKAVGPNVNSYKAEVDSIKVGGVVSNNYTVKLTDESNTWLSITQYNIALTADDIVNKEKVYDGKVLSNTVTKTFFGKDVTITFKNVGPDVGDYALELLSEGAVNNANFTATIPVMTLKITKKAYTITSLESDYTKSKTYDTTNFKPENITLNIVDGETVTVSFQEVGPNYNKDGYALAISSWTVAGGQAKAENYDIKVADNNWLAINKVNYAITAVDVEEVKSKVYCGSVVTPDSIAKEFTYGEITEVLTISFKNTTGKDVGSYAFEIDSVKIGDVDATNYNITIPENNWFSITQCNIEINESDIVNKSKYYDGAKLENKITKSINGETVEITFKAVGPDVGEYVLEFESITDSKNYTVSINNIVNEKLAKWLIIHPCEYTLAEKDLGNLINFKAEYTGSKIQPISIEKTIVTGETLVISFEEVGPNVGKHSLEVSEVLLKKAEGNVKATNYTISAPIDNNWFEITKKAVAITKADFASDYEWSKVYDGAVFTPSSITKTVNGEEIVITFKPTTGKNVGNYAMEIASFTKADRFAVTLQENTDWLSITAKEITVSIEKVYDGTTSFTNENATITGVIDADQGKVTVSGNYPNKNVTDTAVSITDITLDGIERGNYTIKSATGTITKCAISVLLNEIENTTKIYDGKVLTPKAVTKDVNGEKITITFNSVGPNAGNYKLTMASVRDSTNYEVTIPDVTLTISKFKYTLKEGDVSFTKVYGENDPDLTKAFAVGSIAETTNSALTNPDALTLTFTRAEGKNVGSYALTNVTVNNANYEISLPANEWFTITVYKLTVDSLPTEYVTTKAYDADGFAPADISYTLNEDNVVISFNKSDKNKGTYKLKDLYKEVNNSNYEVTISDALTVSITECGKVISLEEIPVASRSAVYNGKIITPASFNKDYTFVVGSGSVTEILTISFKAVGTNVGTYKLEIATVTIDGKTATNYSVSLAVQENDWFKISQCDLELTKADFSDAYTWSKRYDGKTFTPASITKAINGETITIEFNSIGPDVTTTKLTPKANSNYNITVADDVKASITAYAYELKEVDIKNGSKTKVYTGQELTPDAMTLTLVEGETLTISFNKVGKNVDTYALAIASTTIDGENATNYSITLPKNKWFSITPFKYTLKAEDVNFTKVYGTIDLILTKDFAVGTLNRDDNAELKNPDALTLTFTRAEGEIVGTYAITNVTTDNTNYEISLPENKWFSITKAELTFTVSKVYDGTTAFTNDNVNNVVGKIGDDEISISGNYPSKDVTTSAVITVYTLSGAASANYSVKAVTGSIEKFTYTLKQEDVKLSKVYGHADPELKVTLTKNSEGINNPDELVITFTRAEGSSVGKYKLTIASVKYSNGDDATNNYTITIPDDNTFFEIEAVKQGLMVAVDGEFTMTYDTTTVTRVATELDSNKWYLAAYTADGTLKARVGLSLYFNDQVAEGTWEVKAVTSDLATMFNGITISIANSLRNAGKYALSISGHNDIYTADATFVDSSYVSASPVFEIKKYTKVLAASELTRDSSWTKAYDGAALTPNSVTKVFIAGETVTISFASVGTDAKKYALSVSGTDNNSYEISVEDNELLEITKRAYTLTASDVESVNSKVYSNSTITPDSIELTLVNSEKLTISFNSVSGTTVGEYEMTVKSVMLGENDAANYEIKAEAGNKWFNITKYQYKVVEGDLGLDYVRTKAYDGTKLEPAAITKVLNGETITVSFTSVGPNAGEYALQFSSVDNSNYEISIDTNTWLSITTCAYELKESDLTTAESKTAVYTSKAITPDAITKELNGETITITFQDVEKTVGKKELVIKSVMIGEEEATNYNITIPAGNTWFEVKQYSYVVNETDIKDIVKTKEYDGENLAPASIEKELIKGSGEMVTINFAPVGTDAKKYALAYASSSDSVNYNITVEANEWLEITKKIYTLTEDDVKDARVKAYTGHNVTPDPIEITLIGSETLKVTFKVAGKDAKTYDMEIDTVTLGGVEATNYNISIPANNQWFSIEHGTYMISKSDFPEDYVWSREYNGQEFTPASITLKLGDDTITVNFEEVDANVGTYTLKIKNMVNAENFDIDINPLTVSITKLSYTLVDSDLTSAAKTAQYNGNVITPGAITLEKVAGEILTIAFENVEKNAGEYPLVIKSVTLGEVDAANYDIKLPTEGLKFTVTKINHVVTREDLGEGYVTTKTYDGTNLTPASISLKLIEDSEEAVIVNFTSVGPNAGEYALAISSIGDSTNYNITISENAWLSIAQKALDIEVSKVYDETTNFTGATIDITGIVGSDEVTVSGAFANANATDSATFTGITLEGAAKDNYSVGNITGSISKYNIEVVAADIENQTKVYDGNVLANVVVKTPFTTEIKITFKSVGPKFGMYSLELDSISDETNYTVTVPSVTLEIKKFTYTLKEGDVSFTKVYGASDPKLEATFEEGRLTETTKSILTNPNKLTLTFTRAAGNNVGSYALTSVVADNENYQISLPADCKWFTITQLTHVITREELPEGYVLTKKYDRNKFKPASVTLKLIEGSEESITVNFSEVGPNAGKYDLTILNVSDNINYNITINGSEWLEITKAELNVTVSKVYDGTTSFTNENATITGILGSDEVTVSGNFDSKDAAESKTIANITLGGAQKDNYYIESATGSISKYNIEVAADEIVNTTKIYDGNKLENVLVKSLHGADITITFKSVGPNAGKYELELTSISDATNYTVTVPSVTLEIKKFAYTLKAGDVSFTKVYGASDPKLEATFEVGRLTETTNSALTNPDQLVLTFTRAEGKDVGIYALTGVTVDNTSYDISLPADCKWFTITKAALTVVVTKEYDGTTAFTNDNADITGLVLGDEITVEGNFVSADVTADTVEITDITLSGVNKDNYTVTATGRIVKANLTGIAVESVTKVYGDVRESENFITLLNGTLTFSNSLVKNAVITNAEIVNPTYSTGRFLSAGEYDIKLSVSSDTVVDFDVTLKLIVEAKALTVKLLKNGSEISSVSKHYDGNDALPEGVTVAVDGLCEGDQIELTAKFGSSEVGSSVPVEYTFTVDTDKDNYDIAYAIRTGTIGSYVFSKITLNNSHYSFAEDGKTNPSDRDINNFNFTNTVTGDSFMTMIGTPSREGYTFLGWYREEEHTSQVIAANAVDYIRDYANSGDSFTLYSNWKAIEIIITLDANKGTIAENPEVWTGSGATVTKAVKYGSTYGQLPLPTRTGYTFLGWKYADNTIEETSNMFVITSHTLIAEWQANTYVVKFNKNGADCEDVMADMTFTYDETTIPANLFTFTGHKFLGWKVNNEGELRTEGEINLSSEQDAVVELFAQWQIEKYNLTFNLNGGTTESTFDGVYEYNQELPTNLTKIIDGKTYRFLGWSLTNDENPTSAQTYTNCPDIGEDEANATLYAMWTISDFDLKITLSNNNYATYTIMAEDGTVVAPITTSGSEYRLNAGVVYKLTINLKPGYIFGSSVADYDPSKVSVEIENNVLTISRINSNTEIVVNVEPRLNTVTINASHATVTKVTVYNGEELDREIVETSITSMQIYTGQRVVIHAEPDAGYEIEDRTIEGFIADETINISATAKTYELTVVNSEGNEEPTFISGWIAGMIKTDTPIVLEVRVKDHYTNLQLSAPEGITIVESEGRYVITGFTDAFILTISTEKVKYDVVMNSVSVKQDEVDSTSTNRATITTSETKALTGNGRETISTEYLTPFTFSASAQQAGYIFDGWYIGLVMEEGRITDYGVKVDPENYTYDPSTNTYSYSGTVEGEYSLTAVFKYIEYTMSISVDSTYNYGTFNYGTEEGLTNTTKLLPFGNMIEIKPVGNKGYEYDKWIVNGEVITESNADLGIELFADGTLKITGKGNLDLVVLFKAKSSSFKAETEIYINGIKVSSEGTNCATMQVGTLDEYGNFRANETSTKFSNGRVPFYTGDDIYLQVELSYGYEFAGFVSEGEGEAVIVDNDYNPGKSTIGEGINQKTYYVRKITALNADNIYQTLKLKVNAIAVNFTVNFINEDNQVVNAGKIFVDDADFGVLANGNGGANVSVNAMVNKELTITAYSRFDFSIVSSGSCYKLNNTSTSIFNDTRTDITDRTKGFTSTYKFSVRDYIDGTEISIRVVSATYTVELYDGENLVGEKITGARVGNMLNTTNVIAAIRELAASKSQYELIGFYTSENGLGEKYIDNDGNCLKAWNENGYYWNGQEYVTLPNFDPTTNTIKLYASWARMKSAIKISTVPKGIKNVNPTVAAKLVITTINNTNSWTTENDLFFADMLYGADIGITAPVYENYKFHSWTIILDGTVQDPIYESSYYKKGGFNCKEVEIYANYFAKVSLSAEKGGTATLTAGDIVIKAGGEDYIPTTTEFTLNATPNKGYLFKGWFNVETGELISDAANYIYRLDSENELSPISIIAKFEGEAVRISIGDYDRSNGHIEKIYLNGEKVEESINARIGDEVEFYVYVDTSKKYGIKWNSQFITYDRKDAVSMAHTECLIYKYIVNADDVVDGEIVIAPTITEDKINVRLDIRLFNNSKYEEAGEIIGDGIVNGKLSLSFGEDLVITVKVKDYYRIESIQLDNRSIGEYLAGEMLIIPSSALNGLDATQEHVLLIKFTEKLWIETNNLPAQLQGDGTERNPYLITSAEELALVAYKINIEKNQSYANSRFKLTKDISLIGKFWTPIGTEDCKFNGVFNFNGFKVYGLSLQSGYDKENTHYNGVFGYLGERAEIIINNNAITIIAISCSVGAAVIIIGLTIFFVVRKRRKKKMDELANG